MATISLQSLKESVYDKLEGNTRFYESVEVVRSINDAIKVMNIFTGFMTGSVTIQSVASQYSYTVPAGIFLVARVKYAGKELDPLGFHSLCESNPRWMSQVATADGPVATWTALGLQRSKRIILNPAPHRANAPIEVFGVVEATPLVNDADTINVSTEFSDLIAAYAAHDRMMKNGGKVSADAMIVYKAFLKRMESLKRYKRKVAPNVWFQFTAPEEQK